jgi:hypothetical protein
MIVKLDAFCEACEAVKSEWLKKVEENKDFNYIIVAENTSEQDQYDYLKEKGFDMNKVFICVGTLDGINLIDRLSTPSLVFIDEEGLIRIVHENFFLDGDAMVSYLNYLRPEFLEGF